MPDMPTKDDSRLRAFYDALADSILEASDADVEIELRERALNPTEVASNVQRILLAAVKQFKQRKLSASQSMYEAEVERIRTTKYSLPSSAEERRALLWRVITGAPSMSGLVTAQHRDFKDLTDTDVIGLLQQLGDLGVLGDGEGRSGGELQKP